MRKYLIIILLLIPSLCFGNDAALIMGKAPSAISTILGKAKAGVSSFAGAGVAAAAATPEVFYETFAGANAGTDCSANFDNTGWVCTLTASNTVTNSSSISTLSIGDSGAGKDLRLFNDFANHDDAEWYISFDFKVSSTWGATYANIFLLVAGQTNAADGSAFSSYIRKDTGYTLYIVSPCGQTIAESVTADAYHTLKFKKPSGANKGSYKLDAGSEVAFTTGSDVSRNIGAVALGEEDISTTTTIYIKEVKICSTAAACGW